MTHTMFGLPANGEPVAGTASAVDAAKANVTLARAMVVILTAQILRGSRVMTLLRCGVGVVSAVPGSRAGRGTHRHACICIIYNMGSASGHRRRGKAAAAAYDHTY